MKKTTKQFIKNHPEVVITRADKGNVTVVLNRVDYIQKMESLISDDKTCARVSRDPIEKISNDFFLLAPC